MRGWLSNLFSRHRPYPINDIVFKPRQRVVRLRERSLILEISWFNLFRLLRRYWVRAGISTAIIVGVIIFVSGNVGRANIATLYATSCLGGWDNPQLAEGSPDVKEAKPDSELFTSKNSAQLKSAAAQIFCGGFKGKIPPDVQPKKVLLKLSWTVLGANSIVPASGDAVPAPLSVPEKPVVIEDTIKPEQVELIIDSSEDQVVELHVDEPIDTLPTTSEIPKAIDQPVSEPPPPPPVPAPEITEPPAPASAPETSWLPWKVFTAIAQELLEEVPVSSTAPLEASTTEIIAPTGTTESVSADSPFLQVMYTLDGKTWNKLALVSTANWRDLAVELPLTSWNELATVQISLQTVPSLAEQPIVLLDSVWLEVEYQGDASAVQDKPDLKRDTIIQLLRAEPYYVVKIFSQARQRHEVWVYQTSGSGEWQRPVVEPDFAVDQPVAFHQGMLFWLGLGQQTINAYDVSSRTYSSQTIDPTQPNIAMMFTRGNWRVSLVADSVERGGNSRFTFSEGDGVTEEAEGVGVSLVDFMVRLGGDYAVSANVSTTSVTSTAISASAVKDNAPLVGTPVKVLPTSESILVE
jgi:hypothetical protein